jgi:hypothetical protein
MADDQFQRPYRASEPPVRAQGKTPGIDPLAELARLIGQTDPFGEYGRESTRRTSAPQSGERSDWARESGADQRAPQRLDGDGYYATRSTLDEEQPYGGPGYGRQSYGGTPSAAVNEDLYQADHGGRGYPSGQADYQDDSYAHDTAQFPEEEYYEDTPPSRRRLGVIAIAGVFALAVIGTAGAYGYRALFGSSGSTQPPPVIKADTGPSKIVPAMSGKDAQSNKLITDRVNERGESERLVSREEQPVPNPAVVAVSQTASQSTLGSGVVGSEPKKVRTIAIHPDQPVLADATPPSGAPPSAAPLAAAVRPPPAARAVAPSAPPGPPARVADSANADAEQDAAPATTTRSAPPVRQVAPGSSNAPLSLNPDAPSARAAARAPAAAVAPAAPATSRTASVAAPAQMAPAPAASGNAGGPGSYVQVSSQRSEAEAQAAFRSLQAKYPDQLGGRQPMIYKVDLGTKGTYYRAMVGPFTNANEAGELCTNLKAAGGQCLIQKN